MYSGGSHPAPRRARRKRADVELVDPTRPTTEEGVVKLDQAECEIVALVARGMSNREIATHLGKPEGTVKNQLSRVYKKLRVKRRVRLMMMFRP